MSLINSSSYERNKRCSGIYPPAPISKSKTLNKDDFLGDLAVHLQKQISVFKIPTLSLSSKGPSNNQPIFVEIY